MQSKMTAFIASLAILWFATSVHAGEMKDGYYLTTSDAEFADVISDLHDAVINRGLVIDFVGQVGEMLTRTSAAVAMDNPFSSAEYFHFCSAKLTHAAVAANPENIAICPYVVFAYALKTEPGKVWIGYRRPSGTTGAASEAAVGAIEDLLKEVVDEAVE